MALARASFAGIAFPVSDIEVTGGMRHHVHEYPHSPGGVPEKLGRKLYRVRFSAWFHELSGTAAEQFPGLWPEGLARLRAILDGGTTEDLVVPTVGTIKAFAVEWSQKYSTAQAIDGEKVSLEFLEDQDGLSLSAAIELGANSIEQAAETLDAAAALRDYTKKRKPGLFEQINDAVGAFTALKDQAGLASSLISAKIEGIKSLCSQLESTVEFMGSADAHPIASAARNLWFAADEVVSNLVVPASKTLAYVVPSTTTVVALSQQLYGTTTKVEDLLRLNTFRDPYKVMAGTQVLYSVSA